MYHAPEDIDTDAKRKERFLKGLNGDLRIPLSIAYAPNYQSLLDQAITLDNNIRKEENRKRKFNNHKTHSDVSHKKHHSYEESGSHSSHRPEGHFHRGNGHNNNGHRSNGDHRNHHSGGNRNGHNNGHRNGSHNGNNGQLRPNSEGKRDLSEVTCYKCRKAGHYSNNCPEKKAEDAAKPNPFQKGHVNHLDVEEVMNEPEAVMGTFPLNSVSALFLFDTGASHSFISRAFVNKNGFSTETIGRTIKVSSPGGEMIVNSGC